MSRLAEQSGTMAVRMHVWKPKSLLAASPRLTGTTAIWTQLGLAYLVHKSLIFFRVPLTAAVLPKVVKTLRSWGYNIGKKKPKNKPV